jgi:hypothetical protein
MITTFLPVIVDGSFNPFLLAAAFRTWNRSDRRS